mmetsp:Transcript_21400/g.66922  ORF Transcript_21400/g.66922 Transcript_21400/m.66922 type:complete len:321 (-) Transcript_21400:116-1078(-)
MNVRAHGAARHSRHPRSIRSRPPAPRWDAGRDEVRVALALVALVEGARARVAEPPLALVAGVERPPPVLDDSELTGGRGMFCRGLEPLRFTLDGSTAPVGEPDAPTEGKPAAPGTAALAARTAGAPVSTGALAVPHVGGGAQTVVEGAVPASEGGGDGSLISTGGVSALSTREEVDTSALLSGPLGVTRDTSPPVSAAVRGEIGGRRGWWPVVLGGREAPRGGLEFLEEPSKSSTASPASARICVCCAARRAARASTSPLGRCERVRPAEPLRALTGGALLVWVPGGEALEGRPRPAREPLSMAAARPATRSSRRARRCA